MKHSGRRYNKLGDPENENHFYFFAANSQPYPAFKSQKVRYY